jgi:hypothetical protein
MANRLIIAVLLVALLNACANPHVVRLDTGRGPPLEYSPATSTPPVKVDAEAFTESLTHLTLATPLTLRSPQQGWLVRASHPGNEEDRRWRSLMSKSYGGFCKAGQRREDCLSLLDDVMGLSEWDKLGVALGLSIDPLKESIAKAVEDTLAPQLFFTVIATGIITWAIMAANPEPLFTKAAAIVSGVMLAYLGVEAFLKVVDATRELKWASDRATTWEELEAASQRWANRVGPEIASVFVLAVTVVVSHGLVGGSALLASRLSMLPHFPQASAAGASRAGIKLSSVGDVSAVAVIGNTIIISLPATAVAVVAQGLAGEAAAGPDPVGFRSWGSFNGLKSALGPAGAGKQWHHIVEQTPSNVERFGPQALHNTENVIALDERTHRQISAYYSSIDLRYSSEQTIRQWLSGQSFQAQREFGLKVLRDYGMTP